MTKNVTLNQNHINNISKAMKLHYESAFQHHGPNSAGVDWGNDAGRMFLRYDNMLALLSSDDIRAKHSLLDVGCGYGGFQSYAQQKGITLKYTGIDIASNMISWAKENLKEATFIDADFLSYDFHGALYDYVICNGILTQKLDSSLLDMDKYSKALMNKMYGLCKKGTAFNMMTTAVNYFSPNLYYKHPAEILSYCLSEISRKVKIDHSYGLYEFTAYLYK